MEEWKLIETAPKDGQQILVFANGIFTTVAWFDIGCYWSLVQCGLNCDDSEFWPTHWMPLPNPPSAQS